LLVVFCIVFECAAQMQQRLVYLHIRFERQAYDGLGARTRHPGYPGRELHWLTHALDVACLEALEYIHRGDAHGGNMLALIKLYESQPEKLTSFLAQKASINIAQSSAYRQVVEQLGATVFANEGMLINKKIAGFQFWAEKDYPFPGNIKSGHTSFKFEGVAGVAAFDDPDKSVCGERATARGGAAAPRPGAFII
jgi:hypothetical protein